MIVMMNLKTWNLVCKVCTSSRHLVAHGFHFLSVFYLLTLLLENQSMKVVIVFELLKKYGNFIDNWSCMKFKRFIFVLLSWDQFLRIVSWHIVLPLSPKPYLYMIPYKIFYYGLFGFAGSSDGKGSAYSVGDLGLIPGLGRSPGEGNGNPL